MTIAVTRDCLRTALLLAVSMANHACARTISNTSPSEDPEPQTVTYCDLVAHPERYDRKTVRVRAVLDHTDFEKDNLDDVTCEVGKAPKAGMRLGKIWVIGPIRLSAPRLVCLTLPPSEFFTPRLWTNQLNMVIVAALRFR